MPSTRYRIFVLLSVIILLLSSGAGNVAGGRLKGKVKENIYHAPGKNFKVPVLSGLGMRISDSYHKKDGAGSVSFQNYFGGLHGILYGALPPEAAPFLEDPDRRVEALRIWLHKIALPGWFLPNVPKTKVLHEGEGILDGKPVWLAILDLPGASSLVNITAEGQKHRDSVRGVIVFDRGGYMYLLMYELASVFGGGRDAKPDAEKWTEFTGPLTKFYETIEFAD